MKSRAGLIALLLLAGLCLAVAWLRFDLLLAALQKTFWNLHKGWPIRLYVLGQIALLFSIIALTFWTIPSHVDAAQDVPAAAAALILGSLVEIWGTRTGLWEYYTREQPPWWIVPVWPIGTLVIARIARRAEGWGRHVPRKVYRAFYSLFAALFVLVGLGFAGPRLDHLGLALMTGLTLVLFARPDYPRDACVLATGAVLVFFADLWGTDNLCWSYAPGARGLFPGSLFGALFDSAAVLACLKLARSAGRFYRRGHIDNIGL